MGCHGCGFRSSASHARYAEHAISVHTRTTKMAAGAGWSHEETRALVGIWAAADVQRQLRVFDETKLLHFLRLGTNAHGSSVKKKKSMIQKYKKVS